MEQWRYYLWTGITSLDDEEFEEATGKPITSLHKKLRDYLRDEHDADYFDNANRNPTLPYIIRADNLDYVKKVAMHIWETEKAEFPDCPNYPFEMGIEIIDNQTNKPVMLVRERKGLPTQEELKNLELQEEREHAHRKQLQWNRE